jgi:hypothetical protein
MKKRSAEHRQAISAACLRSERSRQTRSRVAMAISQLVRAGYAHLLSASIREVEIVRVLNAIAAAIDPVAASHAELAVLKTLVRTPRAFTTFLRRNKQFVRDQVTAAEQDNAPVP